MIYLVYSIEYVLYSFLLENRLLKERIFTFHLGRSCKTVPYSDSIISGSTFESGHLTDCLGSSDWNLYFTVIHSGGDFSEIDRDRSSFVLGFGLLKFFTDIELLRVLIAIYFSGFSVVLEFIKVFCVEIYKVPYYRTNLVPL